MGKLSMAMVMKILIAVEEKVEDMFSKFFIWFENIAPKF